MQESSEEADQKVRRNQTDKYVTFGRMGSGFLDKSKEDTNK